MQPNQLAEKEEAFSWREILLETIKIVNGKSSSAVIEHTEGANHIFFVEIFPDRIIFFHIVDGTRGNK
jgi:hypothetical protein